MEGISKFRHKICGFEYEKPTKHYHCPKCQKAKSKGEKEIKQYLITNNINFIQEKQVKIKGHNLRFDFYVPSFNTFIEFQGIQHFEPVEYFGGISRFSKQKIYDNLKKQYCQEQKIKLLEITYLDLDKNLVQQILSSTFKVQRLSQ